MRTMSLVAGGLLVAFTCLSCGGATPISPSATAARVEGAGGIPSGSTTAGNGEPAPAPIGLTGVVRGLDVGAGTFSLVARPSPRTILCNGDTEVWNRGTRVRLSSLRDGQSVSVRGFDHTRYVLARSISLR